MSDDLISRQAAIDAQNDEITITGRINAIVVQDYILRMRNRLYDLPSVQPERWIPVTERLPENTGKWLCCTSDGDVMILFYDAPGTKERVFYRWDDRGYFYRTFDVIAWMPLPEPWRG